MPRHNSHCIETGHDFGRWIQQRGIDQQWKPRFRVDELIHVPRALPRSGPSWIARWSLWSVDNDGRVHRSHRKQKQQSYEIFWIWVSLKCCLVIVLAITRQNAVLNSGLTCGQLPTFAELAAIHTWFFVHAHVVIMVDSEGDQLWQSFRMVNQLMIMIVIVDQWLVNISMVVITN